MPIISIYKYYTYIILLLFLKNDPLWTHKSDFPPGKILKIANILTVFSVHYRVMVCSKLL